MDSSLARGIKNQLFREISNAIGKEIDVFKKNIKSCKAGTSLNNWNRFVKSMPASLPHILVDHVVGGSKRKPYLCLSTLDSQHEKSFNHWTEKCINSVQFLINYSPWYSEAIYAGYSLSEHTIHRIFERVISLDSLNNSPKPHYLFTSELNYTPFWSAFWTYTSFRIFKDSESSTLYPVIPTPSGLFFAEIYSEKIHKIEIRTFVSIDMLYPDQKELREMMIESMNKISNNTISYYPCLAIAGIKNQESEFAELEKVVSPLLPLLLQISTSNRSRIQLFDDLSSPKR
jgi:hypothetical protein